MFPRFPEFSLILNCQDRNFLRLCCSRKKGRCCVGRPPLPQLLNLAMQGERTWRRTEDPQYRWELFMSGGWTITTLHFNSEQFVLHTVVHPRGVLGASRRQLDPGIWDVAASWRWRSTEPLQDAIMVRQTGYSENTNCISGTECNIGKLRRSGNKSFHLWDNKTVVNQTKSSAC